MYDDDYSTKYTVLHYAEQPIFTTGSIVLQGLAPTVEQVASQKCSSHTGRDLA